MSKILVCQHVAHEPLGTLNPLFKDSGLRIRYVNFGRDPHAQPTLEGYEGLVILGGPMNVDEGDKHPHLNHEPVLIEEAVRRDIPVLGICLGAQLIAKALGARVMKNPVKEIGWYDVRPTGEGKKDPLIGTFAESEKIFQWHGDTFSIPAGCHHLATADTCAHQAFRYGKKVYGFQFHLEVDEKLIHRWLEVPVNRRDLELMKTNPHTASILEQTPHFINRLKELSRNTFGKFLELFGPERKFTTLPSR